MGEYKTYEVKIVRLERHVVTGLVYAESEEEARAAAEDNCIDADEVDEFTNFEGCEVLSVKEVPDGD
jgi:hypothetical protein